jgi:nitrite reductase/ring-hydroxylating ferredoxin subunit
VSCKQAPVSNGEGVWTAASSLPVSDLKFPLRAKVGTETIVIHRTKHGFRAMDKGCPHQGASWMLGDLIMDESMVKCPLHAYTFRLSDGKGVNCPGFRMKVFDVKETEGRLYVRVPDHAVAQGR